MPRMDRAEIEMFLNDDRHAVLATNRPSGMPQLTPVWFLYEAGRLYVSAQVGTAKVRNLRRDPHISLCVDGGRGDARYVTVAGVAELIEPGHPCQQEMRRRIVGKYHRSHEAAERYFESIRDNPAVLIVVTPQKVISQNGS